MSGAIAAVREVLDEMGVSDPPRRLPSVADIMPGSRMPQERMRILSPDASERIQERIEESMTQQRCKPPVTVNGRDYRLPEGSRRS